jgi:serine/threonine protein kinase
MTIKGAGRITSLGSHLVVKPRVLQKPQQEPPQHVAHASDYELLEVLGEGGMGVVYSARQASIDRIVAVKMLKPEMMNDEELRSKFLSEAAITGDLDHPNIVPIHDLGSDEHGAPFYSMKQVRGTPWMQVIGQKTQTENLDISAPRGRRRGVRPFAQRDPSRSEARKRDARRLR